ncbi:MAG TPA: serine/threonine-protein kinase [Gemmatimonadaceae bacterium]|nr:serine/threonine-protein kinase [Gemmatimonadaceae bacterium]
MRAHVDRVLTTHYELDDEIGRGGMGIVYRAKDRRLKRTVAIKVLPPELAFRSDIRSRFLREAETAAQLGHPHIVPIYSVDEAEGLVFFVMAYVRGANLAKRLHEKGVLDTDEVRRILCEVASALAYAHERGVVHRDIKPDNILLDADSGRAMVTDFGIARAVDSSSGDNRLTATGMAIGTPAYMSPEQAAGEREIDGRSDLYSLGVLGYQMLCGEPPFTAASTPAMLVKHISERPTPIEQRRADCPEDLARAVMLLLEKDPANRFPDAASLVAGLERGEMPVMRRQGGVSTSGVSTYGTQPAGLVGGAARYGETSRTSGYGGTAYPVYDAGDYSPTPEDEHRWRSPDVERFRRTLAPYLFVNAVIVVAAIFTGVDIIFVTVLWSIYLAYRYAKLWSEGYDWRDVFRQPRDRELLDVMDDMGEELSGIFDRDKRRELKERRRQRALMPRRPAPALPAGGTSEAAALHGMGAGPTSARVRQALDDSAEIVRLVATLPKSERARIPDVTRSADALAVRVRALAATLAEIERDATPGALVAVEDEVQRLEGEANPLEPGSEERVRRLAYLKRQRRALVESERKREAATNKLETCALALQNMKLDLVRLRSGAQSHKNVTALALDALHLADSVDGALGVAAELSRTSGRTEARPTAR